MAKKKPVVLHPLYKYAAGKFTKAARDVFLKELIETGRIGHSAHVSGVSTQTVDYHRKNFPEFDALCRDALEEFNTKIEQEIYRRAVIGVERPVFQGGVLVGVVKEYSDRLLEIEAKRRMPAAYNDKMAIDMNVSGGVLVVPGQKLKSDEWQDQFQKSDPMEIPFDIHGNNGDHSSNGNKP
jgi:hypothetical protein